MKSTRTSTLVLSPQHETLQIGSWWLEGEKEQQKRKGGDGQQEASMKQKHILWNTKIHLNLDLAKIKRNEVESTAMSTRVQGNDNTEILIN
jgi:hypothetical protein